MIKYGSEKRSGVTSAKLREESGEVWTAPPQADSATTKHGDGGTSMAGYLVGACARPVGAVVQGSLQPLDRGGLQRVRYQSHQMSG